MVDNTHQIFKGFKKMVSSKNRSKLTLQILKEILGDFINVFLGNVWNKIGLSVLLMGLAIICILSPIVGLNDEPVQKPLSFYIIGGVLILISLYLVGRRWKELKEKNHG